MSFPDLINAFDAVAAATVASQPAPPLAGDNPASPHSAPCEAAAGRAFSHLGYVMVEGDEWDGDGFHTTAYFARPEGGGPSEWLDHDRFSFTPTYDWFCGAVDRMIERNAWLVANPARWQA